MRAAGAYLGRRGAFLLSMGLAWICYGVATLTTATPAAQTAGLTIITDRASLHLLGWVWVLCGATGVAFCAVRTVGADQWGFTALIAPAVLWSASYLVDWVLVGGYSRGWVVASTYAAMAASIKIASGWPEVRRVARE